MSVDSGSDGGSWPPRSNSVESSTGGLRASDESRSYEERVADRAAESVAEFREKYPYLAGLPISRTPGRNLRSELVEETYETEHVEPETEFESGFTVDRLDRAEPVTFAETLFQFLTARQAYDDGLGGRFESVDGEEFVVDFNDCWTVSYGDEQAARNAAFQRQLMGGEYPENEDSERSGESVDGEWSGDTATIMLTRTGSAVPDGRRVSPVDHADSVARTWSGGVYDVVRNVCEFELGLESDRWGYVRGDDVHGMDADEPGENACYVHAHDAIYIDLGATGLRDVLGSDEEIIAVLESMFYGAIEKHMELCDLARPEAHTRERAIDVRLDLEEPAGYATAYLRLQEGTEMMDMPIEFQAFAAVEWATNRQRIARSKVFNQAARADFCLQDKESDHGGRLRYDRGEVVCACCGSSVGIEAETMAEYRLNHEEPPESPAEGGASSERVIGRGVGESPAAADVRASVRAYIDRSGEPESASLLMGHLGIDPSHRSVVEEELSGEDSSGVVEPIVGIGSGPAAQYELKAMVLPDGGEEMASPGGGGVDMAELVLPEERLLRETRLKYHGRQSFPHGEVVGCPKIVIEDSDGRVSTYEAETAAEWLVERGYRRPWHAELALSFTYHGRKSLPDEFEERVAEPPVRE